VARMGTEIVISKFIERVSQATRVESFIDENMYEPNVLTYTTSSSHGKPDHERIGAC